MELLQNLLENQFSQAREEIGKLRREHGDFVIGEVSISQIYGGMRGVRGLVCDTSSVDPVAGLSIRGFPVASLQDRCPEEIFWLLLTGKLPDDSELQKLREELLRRRKLPAYVADLLALMPADSHPMTMFNAAILAMQREAHFAAAYGDCPRDELWRPALEDALDLMARLPVLAATVYQRRYGKTSQEVSTTPDWTTDLSARLLGRQDTDFTELLRRYVVVQSDHENGNVCAFSAHITGSTHSDLYYAISAGLNGLAGHIHGLAAQDFIRFLTDLRNELDKGREQDIKQLLSQRLAAGKVIPGFGHAVLRQQDPRFEILRQQAAERFGDDPLFLLAGEVHRFGTEVLRQHPRVKNPHPNVDAITGVVLMLAGISELEFYTVLFGTSLSIGMLAQNVISHGIASPIIRPRSVSLAEIRNLLPH